MAKLKLNQVIAIATGEKSRSQSVLTKIYQTLSKKELFDGLTKRYTKADEEGEQLPPEDKHVQMTVQGAIDEAKKACTSLFNIVAQQDKANCKAAADIVVDDKVVATSVPVTTLLFLEKRLQEQVNFISQLPVLDPGEKWNSHNTGLMVSETKTTNRTKKVPRNHVKAEATDKHPAQVEVYHEDVVIGTFETTKFSGAIPKKTRDEMLDRVRKLENAVKVAREQANSIETDEQDLGQSILNFIYDK